MRSVDFFGAADDQADETTWINAAVPRPVTENRSNWGIVASSNPGIAMAATRLIGYQTPSPLKAP